MNGFTYDEVARERLTILLEGVIRELAWQDEIKTFYKKDKMLCECSYKETAELFTDRIYGMDDKEFAEFKNKLIELIYDI